MKNKAYAPDILHAYIVPTEDAHQVIMDPVSSWLFIISWSFRQQLYIKTVQYVYRELRKVWTQKWKDEVLSKDTHLTFHIMNNT